MFTLPAAFESADSFSLLIFEIGWKSTVILGSVFLSGKLLKRQSASFKQIVYSTGILTMLCFIVITPLSPRRTIDAPKWLSIFSLTAPERQSFQSDDGNFGFAASPGIQDKKGGERFISSVMTIFPIVWLAATLFLLGRLTANLYGR